MIPQGLPEDVKQRMAQALRLLYRWEPAIDEWAAMCRQALRFQNLHGQPSRVVARAYASASQLQHLSELRVRTPLDVLPSRTSAIWAEPAARQVLDHMVLVGTHAALRASIGATEAVLAGVERDLMRKPAAGLESLLQRWGTQVGLWSSRLDASDAFSISQFQYSLIRHCNALVRESKMPVEVNQDRLQQALDKAEHVWRVAIDSWGVQCVPAARGQVADGLGRHTTAIRNSLRETLLQDQLEAFTRSGWGGNTAVAAAITPRLHWRTSPLIDAAVGLERHSGQIGDPGTVQVGRLELPKPRVARVGGAVKMPTPRTLIQASQALHKSYELDPGPRR